MRRGFVFMLDAFISLLIVVAFVSMLNQYSRDYSYLQDEALYSYGRSIMNILLHKSVDYEVSNGVIRQLPLIHALSANPSLCGEVMSLVPEQYGVSIQYYDGQKWKDFDSCVHEKQNAMRSISVISTVPVIIENEQYTTPYKYGDYCDPGEGEYVGANVCELPSDLYTPDDFATGSSGYGSTYVRVVVSV